MLEQCEGARGVRGVETDPLPSWGEGETRQSIVDFVARVSREDSPDYVIPAERIATFDNDGTLWAEKPMYFQLLFALDRVREIAPQYPEWEQTEPFASLLKGDVSKALAGGMQVILEILRPTHAGMTTDEFEKIVTDWIDTARHPASNRPYTEMVYRPMLELLDYLRANRFRVFMVSAGGIEFMRPWVERVYGIPPEHVIGSSIKTEYQIRDGRPVLARLPELEFMNEGDGKPRAIHTQIGRRPIAAFGNSDGDVEMLQWTTAGEGPRLGLLVHHTDSEREWAYDRDSNVGRLSVGLEQARASGWTVVDMKRDWSTVFPD